MQINYYNIIIKILNFFDFFQQKNIINLIKKKFLKPLVIIDVGAHHGETIKLFIKKLAIKKIYSFEASPKNFDILKKKTSYYKSDIVKIYNYGVGEKIFNTYINQNIESSSSTINRLNKNSNYLKRKIKILNINNDKPYQYKIPIKMISLDHFIKKEKIDYIDILKIDTEGYEFNVLKGLSNNINLVKIIYFEHHYDDMILKDYKFSDIHNLLTSYNFIMIKKSKMFFRKSFEYVYENINILK